MARERWQVVCTRCHEVSEAEWVVPGSVGNELLLYLLSLPLLCIAGVAYTSFRQASAHWECPVCASREIVPINSRRARAILGDDGAAT